MSRISAGLSVVSEARLSSSVVVDAASDAFALRKLKYTQNAAHEASHVPNKNSCLVIISSCSRSCKPWSVRLQSFAGSSIAG